MYPVDPRGLPVFEFDLSEPSVSSETDRQYLNATMDSLRTLAENTDGRAIVNRNDLEAGMQQIMRDSSAYYLLGYSSSAAPADGKFHEIKVRVKRPGVQVRARKGYWALNAEQTSRALAPPKPAPPPAVTAALNSVASSTTRARIIRTWVGTSRGENGKTRVTFVWEPMPRSAADRPLGPGSEQPARVSLTAVGPSGSPVFRGACPGYGGGVGVARRFVFGGDRRCPRAGLARGFRRDARQDGTAPVGRGRLRCPRFRNPRNRRTRISRARRRRSARPCCSEGARRGTSSR